MIALRVRQLLRENSLELRLIRGKKGLQKKITIPQIQKPGLALGGHTANLHPGRIQVLGTYEVQFLKTLSSRGLREVTKKLGTVDIACIVVTHRNHPPRAMLEEAERHGIPLFLTNLPTSTFVIRVTKYLEEKLTESSSLHGVLVDVFGIGILLIGKSGIGKSECGLELVMKGHRLVADDIVYVRKRAPNSLYGFGSDLTKYHIEIRGLGILNIKDLFGVASVRDQKLIELVIQLVEWNPRENYERLGVDDRTYDVLGVETPLLRIPVRPGRSLTSVIEVAARNQLLKAKGIHSAREFQEKLTQQLLLGGRGLTRLKELVE